MYQPVVLFIGLRYMVGLSTDRFGRFVSWLSCIGIALGVMALITVLSVMNGFEQELQNNILRLMPQAIISSTTNSLDPQKLPKSSISKLHGVSCIVPLTTSDVILQSAYNVAIGVMLGIDPAQKDPLTPYIIKVEQNNLEDGKYNIILGKQLLQQLGVNIGDQLRVIVPSVNKFTPIGRLPTHRLFKVIGIFYTNSEVDNYQMLVNIQDASRLMCYPLGNISGWRLWLKEPLKVHELSQQKLPYGARWQDWRMRKGDLFQAIRMEKNIMGLLLSLIIIIATFNIITSLELIIMEKRSEVAILQIQGLTPYQIMAVFIVQGISMGIIGIFLGALLGILLASHLNKITPIIDIILNNAALPVVINPIQVACIILATITTILLSTFYPSWRSTTIQPIEILRYE